MQEFQSLEAGTQLTDQSVSLAGVQVCILNLSGCRYLGLRLKHELAVWLKHCLAVELALEAQLTSSMVDSVACNLGTPSAQLRMSFRVQG